MDRFSIQCFLAVAETGSFTLAADRMGRTQSAMTQQIKKLEDQLGKRLFHRSKHCSLTHDGEVFFTYATRLQMLYQETIDRFSDSELEGEIFLGIPEDFATMFLSEILADFSRIHPRIRVNVECDLTMNIYTQFQNQKLDMVLVKMKRREDFPHGVTIWSEPLEWVGAIDEEIEAHDAIPLVLAPKPCIYRSIALNALESSSHSSRMAFSSPSFVGNIAAVKAGMGLTVLPQFLVPESVKCMRSPLLPKLPNIHVSLLKRSGNNLSLKTLENYLIEKLSSIN